MQKYALLFFALIRGYTARRPMSLALPWGTSACNAWWRSALQFPAHQRGDGAWVCHPLTQLAWSSSAGLPELTVAELPPAQVPAGSYAERAGESAPSLLTFPGPGVVNSAARALALPVDWQRTQRLALELASGQQQAEVLVVRRVAATGDWAVAAPYLELVIAHALLDRPVAVAVDPVSETIDDAPRLDAAKLHAVHRRAGSEAEPVARRGADASEGWARVVVDDGGGESFLVLDPEPLMSSRDLESPCWPKCHHLACKMSAAAASHHERRRVFGDVPVRWVASAGRWTSGSRHRPMAALLSGTPLVAIPASGSVRPSGVGAA